MTDSYVLTAPGYPSLRVSRVVVGGARGYDVDFLMEEWGSQDEARHMSSWLAPAVRAFVEHDQLARAVNVLVDPTWGECVEAKTPRALALELLKYLRLFVSRGVLHRARLRGTGAWRFTAGPHTGAA